MAEEGLVETNPFTRLRISVPELTSHRPFEDWGRFIPEHATAVSLLDRLLHRAVVVFNSGTQS